MEKKRWYLDPGELTPEERLDRVVKLLAIASVRVATEQKEKSAGAEGAKKEEIGDPLISSSLLLPAKTGPVPYGQKVVGMDRAINEREGKWMKLIEELAKCALSTEKIAKRLNEEDKESRRAGRWTRTAVWRILKRLKEKGVTY